MDISRLNLLQGSDDKVHTCGECNTQFTDLITLKTHILACTQLGDTLIGCTICYTWFSNFAHLKAHMFQNHSNDNSRRCNICYKQLTRADLKSHMRVHSFEPIHKHLTCDERFALSREHEIDMLTRFSDDSYTCFVCGKQFKHTRHFNMHLLLHTVRETKGHAVITGVVEGKCLDNQMLTLIGKKHRCSACGLLFADSYCLKRHVHFHIEESKSEYICGHCGKEFTKALLLKLHMHIHILIYTQEKGHAENSDVSMFECDTVTTDVCDNILSAWDQIRCILCDEEFADELSLANHILCHPYICCPICDRKFLLSSDLNRHLELHQEHTSEVCTYCGKIFTDAVKFGLHISIHKRGLCCSFCGEQFRLSSDLQSHIEIHQGKRLRVCVCCGQAFSDVLQFSSHMQIHKHDELYNQYVIDTDHAYSKPN